MAHPEPIPQRKTGCGTWGCGCFSVFLIFILLIVGGLAAVYFFGFRSERFIKQMDGVIVWYYQGMARPRVVKMLDARVSPEEHERVLRTMDAGVQKYLQLSPEQKRTLLEESLLVLWYLERSKVLPPGKAPHAEKFAKEIMEIYEHDSSRAASPHSEPSDSRPLQFQF